MITAFNISNVEGKISDMSSLPQQRFPKLNINVEDVSSKGNKLNISYSFVADYFAGDDEKSPSVGQIKLSGTIEMDEKADAIAEVIKKWNESHTLPVDMAEEVINGLNFRCSATGTLIAYSLGLIPPLVITRTKIEEQGKA
ncbi:hypothetical protein M1373_00880 [Candidatus Marsarchaeota archaeon]|nr:hypothetical protein [Candidatus Marsarchaeota archaeon]MCL5404221.1 hypothetical protein [Candidatus Marsarchaeota archaeon]